MVGLDGASALFNAQGSYAARTPAQGAADRDVTRVAEEFETFFLTKMTSMMQTDIAAEAPFSGGSGERAFQSFLNEAYAEAIVEAGGVGLSDRLVADLVARQTQESPQ